ncbi:MAG: hypothetical protein MHMPM18_002597, partial [Marteilia pararefringens]
MIVSPNSSSRFSFSSSAATINQQQSPNLNFYLRNKLLQSYVATVSALCLTIIASQLVFLSLLTLDMLHLGQWVHNISRLSHAKHLIPKSFALSLAAAASLFIFDLHNELLISIDSFRRTMGSQSSLFTQIVTSFCFSFVFYVTQVPILADTSVILTFWSFYMILIYHQLMQKLLHNRYVLLQATSLNSTLNSICKMSYDAFKSTNFI